MFRLMGTADYQQLGVFLSFKPLRLNGLDSIFFSFPYQSKDLNRRPSIDGLGYATAGTLCWPRVLETRRGSPR